MILSLPGVHAGHLHGVLVGLGPAQAVERLGQTGDLGQLLAQLGPGLGGETGAGETELVHLLLDGREHLGVLVPDVEIDQLGVEIQPLVAVAVPEPDPLGLGHVDGIGGALDRPRKQGVVAVVLGSLVRKCGPCVLPDTRCYMVPTSAGAIQRTECQNPWK